MASSKPEEVLPGWICCDVCGKSPCPEKLQCPTCFAPYCSVECSEKDLERKTVPGHDKPLGSHRDFCPEIIEKGKEMISLMFSGFPYSFVWEGRTWYALPKGLMEPFPLNMCVPGSPHWSDLLHLWARVPKIPGFVKPSTGAFVASEDAARILTARHTDAQTEALHKAWGNGKTVDV